MTICDPTEGCCLWVLSHDQTVVIPRIYLFSFTKTQNELEPFGDLIRVPMTCHDLNFQGDRPNGASNAQIYVSKDLFFAEALTCHFKSTFLKNPT